MSEQRPPSPMLPGPPPPIAPVVQRDQRPVGSYIPTNDERTMAMLAWLLGILTGWIGPLIMWLIKRDQSRFVDFHGKQSLFLHLAVMILLFPAAILMFIPFVVCLVFPVVLLLAVGLLVLQIVAAVKANSGQWFCIPVIGNWAK